MRLDRYISNATGLSRRLVHQHIKAGDVTVGGHTAKSKSLQLEEPFQVFLNGALVEPAEPVYLMLNKPEGVVCANTDSEHPTVIDLLEYFPEAFHPTDELQIVGRLDIDTTGLVLLTTDGKWNHRVSSPNSHCDKLYRLTLSEAINDEAIAELEGGVLLHSETKLTKPCRVTRLSDTEFTIELHEGKYHQVKRMFAAVGGQVIQLHRERIGHIQLDQELEPGECRALTANEISFL